MEVLEMYLMRKANCVKVIALLMTKRSESNDTGYKPQDIDHKQGIKHEMTVIKVHYKVPKR